MEKNIRTRFGWLLTSTFLCGLLIAASAAPVPSAEKILPSDTLFLLTIPDVAKAREIYKNSPTVQFWHDPAMKPFREKFMERVTSEYLQPLERKLNVKFSDYTNLPQGQLTFAVVQNGWQGKSEKPPALLLLLDTKIKSAQLKTNLADLKKKWVDAGKKMRTEKIRDVEFSVVQISDEEAKALKKAIPGQPEELENPEDKAKQPKHEVFIGQTDSLLIVCDAANVVEKILSRLAGGSVPALGEVAAYQSSHNSLFRDAPVYGWANTKTLLDVLTKSLAEDAEESPFMAMRPEKIIAATGIGALKTAAFNVTDSSEGAMVNVFLAAPESSRQGLFKIIAGDAKETLPPPFVPADVVKFQRWRADGQKSWATLEKMFNEIDPRILGSINYVLDLAAASAKEKDPDFDLKKNLVGNLGDDIISYEKAARSGAAAESASAPSLTLIGSPHPEQLIAALKNLFVIFPSSGEQTAASKEREFLGRKIYSTPLPSLPGIPAKPTAGKTLSYAASGGYVALSTDAAMLEEYLRSSETPPKSLRETPGLTAAAQKVTGAGTSWFGFENQAETMRGLMELLKKDPTALNRNKFAAVPGLISSGDDKDEKPWIDVTLLPPFDKVSKYFYFTVYGISANVEGLSLKFFAPVPPQMKKAAEAPAK